MLKILKDVYKRQGVCNFDVIWSELLAMLTVYAKHENNHYGPKPQSFITIVQMAFPPHPLDLLC